MIQHVYRPRGTALEAFRCRAPELVLSGPAGTGKSRALLEKLHGACLATPRTRALIVRKTLTSLGSTALVTWREQVAKESLANGDVEYYGGSTAEPAQYRYRSRSSITLGGMDKATKIMSSEYDLIYVQEAIELTENDWEALTTRLRNHRISFQQIMGDTNPAQPTHWLKQRADRGATVLLNTRHEDNPTLFEPDLKTLTQRGQSYIDRLDALTGVRRDRLRFGRWTAAEGLVYETYEPAVHSPKHYRGKGGRITPAPDWKRYWSVDFGFTNPMVVQCWAEDPDGRLYLYRERYQTGTLVEDMAAQLLADVRDPKTGQWTEPKPDAIVCDHDAEDRATLERHLGIATIAAKKTVSDGIQAVQVRFKAAGDGHPRIYLMPDARVQLDRHLADAGRPTSTAEEVLGYVWQSGSSVAARANKEVPVKQDDHGMDAMRYLVAYRDLRTIPRVRFMG